MSKTWKVLNKMTNRSTNKNPINLIEKNGVVIDNVSQIAEEFNKFFVNVGPNLANQIQPSENSPLDFIKGKLLQLHVSPPINSPRKFLILLST